MFFVFSTDVKGSWHLIEQGVTIHYHKHIGMTQVPILIWHVFEIIWRVIIIKILRPRNVTAIIIAFIKGFIVTLPDKIIWPNNPELTPCIRAMDKKWPLLINHILLSKGVAIFPGGHQRPAYPTWSTLWVPMTWRWKERWHRQSQCCPYSPKYIFNTTMVMSSSETRFPLILSKCIKNL